MPIPIPIASTSSLDPVRQLIVRGLDRYTGEFWVTPKPRMAPQGMRCEDKVVEDEIRRGMRRLAYNALREDDAASIAIFAYVVIGDISIHVDRDETGVHVERDARSATPYEKEQQFRAMFNLESEEGWAAVRAQGKNEILKPEYSFAQKLHRLNLQVAYVLYNLLSLPISADTVSLSSLIVRSNETRCSIRLSSSILVLPTFHVVLQNS